MLNDTTSTTVGDIKRALLGDESKNAARTRTPRHAESVHRHKSTPSPKTIHRRTGGVDAASTSRVMRDNITVDEVIDNARNIRDRDTHPLDFPLFGLATAATHLVEGVYMGVWDIIAAILHPFIFKLMKIVELNRYSRILIVLALFGLGVTYLAYGIYAVTAAMNTIDNSFHTVSLTFTIIVAVFTLLFWVQSELYPRWREVVRDDMSVTGDHDVFTLKFGLVSFAVILLICTSIGVARVGFETNITSDDDDDGRFIVYDFNEQTLTPSTDIPSSLLAPDEIQRTTLETSDELISESEFEDFLVYQAEANIVIVVCLCAILLIVSYIWVYVRPKPLYVGGVTHRAANV